MITRTKSAESKLYYGWIVVITGFVIFTVALGIQFTFGVFFKPLQDTFGWTRATTSLAMTIHLIVYSLFLIPAGWAMDRINTRVLYSIAALLIGLSLVLSSRISEPWQLYLLYGLILGMGVSVCGPPIMATVTRWFVKERRGLALGIASAGTGFGTLVVAPVSNALITSYGWRNAFLILGIVSCIVLLVCAYYLKMSPEKATSRKKSAVNKTGNPVIDSSSSMSFGQAIRTREMLLIMLTVGFANFALRMVMVHLAPHAQDIGFSEADAALAVGAIGAFSVVGRLVMGFVQDRIGPRRSMLICMSIQGVSMIILPFIASNFMLFAYTLLFGFTYGGDIPQLPAITAQLFGVASLGMTFGMVQAVANLMGSLGPMIAGYVFDLTSSYTIVFLGASAGLFTGVFLISRLKLRN